MGYDPQKYQEKRERVLGIKKRGLGFGTIAGIVSAVIILGLGVVTVPQAVSYITTRHLEDAIYKLGADKMWPDGVIQKIQAMDGVKTVSNDKNQKRLVVTFDRRTIALTAIDAAMVEYSLDAVLLNQVNHHQHQTTLKEEEELETP